MEKKVITIHATGDSSLVIQGLEKKLQAFQKLLVVELNSYLLDFILAYGNLFVFYNLLTISHQELEIKILQLWNQQQQQLLPKETASSPKKIIKIFVYYNTDVGWDLAQIAQQKKLTIDEIIQIHSQATYEVLAIGFAPGFAYMAGVQATLQLPRRDNARLRIPAGSVAISHHQSIVYPSNGAGGWNIIGKTTQPMINWDKPNPCFLQTGDLVKFEAITKMEFLEQGGEIIENIA